MSSTISAAKYALLVGINISNTRYTDDFENLNMAVSEVINVSSLLRKNEWEIEVLTNDNATKEKIVDKLQTKTNHLISTDVFLFYFSGHGIELKSSLKKFTGKKFDSEESGIETTGSDTVTIYQKALINANKNLGCNFGLFPYQNNEESGSDILLADELISHLNKFDCTKIIVIIDACYSGNFNEIRKISLEYSSSKIKTGFYSLTGLFRTYDGLIGRYLIEALEGAANSCGSFGNRDKYISFYEAVTYTSQKVMEIQKKNHEEIFNIRFMIVANEPLNLIQIREE
jgi:hypothetical protein